MQSMLQQWEQSPERGQLLPAERALLYQTVRERQPSRVLEVGTWRGAGSTLQIVRALHDNGNGHLYTCEPDPDNFAMARSLYFTEPLLGQRVTIYNLKSVELIAKLLSSGLVPDFLFFDGPEDADVAVADLTALEPMLRGGVTLCMHDWLGIDSVKAAKIRPYVEASPRWRIDRVLGQPESVGLVVATKI